MSDSYTSLAYRFARIEGLVYRKVVEARATTAAALRRAVFSRAAAHAGVDRGADTVVPDALKDYVDTVAWRAYRVTDEQVAALRKAGYSEDAIFELTVAAAAGAGLARLDIGLRAVHEARR